jgi:hypothetical protein
MNEPSRIESALRAEADKQLIRDISAAVEPFLAIAREGCSDLYSFEATRAGEKLNGYGMVNAMKGYIFEQLKERRRQNHIDAFMEKVNTLSAEVEELKNSIPQ